MMFYINTQKNKLFFFLGQEFSSLYVPKDNMLIEIAPWM